MELTLNELLQKKIFSDLTIDEKQFVLSQITEVEYNDIRFLLINSEKYHKKDFKELTINGSIRKNLSTAFKQKHEKPKVPSINIDIWKGYKNIIRPALSIGVIIVAVFLTVNNIKKNNALLSTDINYVTSYLNKEKQFLKINEKYSSDLIDSNKFNKDSIIEMNNYLQVKHEGLYVN